MPEYEVTIASGKRFRIRADSAEEAKTIIRSRMKSLAGASKHFVRTHDTQTRAESGAERHEFLRKGRPVKAERVV